MKQLKKRGSGDLFFVGRIISDLLNGCWRFAQFLWELKNALGLSGDALLEAIIVARERCKPFRKYSNFPIVLVGATANRLEISIVVCNGCLGTEVIVEVAIKTMPPSATDLVLQLIWTCRTSK